jgi:hypothetical protein
LIDAPYFNISIGSLPDGRITNTLNYNNYNTSVADYCEFGQGLGVIDTITTLFADEINANEEILDETLERTLIYYSKGADRYGKPYYVVNGSALPHFTPIPEECAYWNYSTTDYGQIIQVRTGNQVFLNAHTYVELLYRDYLNSIVSADTLLGYFRNDTAGRKVYFCQLPGINESVLYDFTLIDSAQITNPMFFNLTLDTVQIGGIKRTQWSYYWEDPSADVTSALTTEGIGALWGIFSSPGVFNQPANGLPSSFSARLESFCVCGETLYPDTATGQCSLLTGISNITSGNSIHLYPNPTTDLLHLSFSDAGAYNTKFIITDILGQDVYSSPVTQSETTHYISKLSAGIYTWRVVSPQTPKGGLNTSDVEIIKTGKVVKE